METVYCVSLYQKTVELYGPSNCMDLLVQMDSGPLDRLCNVDLDHPNGQSSIGRLCYVNLHRPNGQRSYEPPILRQFKPAVHVTSI